MKNKQTTTATIKMAKQTAISWRQLHSERAEAAREEGRGTKEEEKRITRNHLPVILAKTGLT